jgi:excisionase family DNA binding protein
MARFSLAALAALDRSAVNRLWMTTADAARVLAVTRQAVTWLAREGVLMGERTVSGQWLFRRATVWELMEARAKARLFSRAAVWRASHLRLVHAAREPRQLALFTAHGGVASAAARRKGTFRSESETSGSRREIAVGPISAAMSPGEGRKRMAKVEEPHARQRVARQR